MIKNIILDLGGVLIDLDPQATAKSFIELGMTDFETHYTVVRQSGVFDRFDKGEVTTEQFRNEMKTHLPFGTTDAQIDKAWNAMLLGIPKHRLLYLDELKKKYRLFLLSNTNEIHVDSFSSQMKKDFGFTELSDFFERWYYSCRIGMRKPDKVIFEHVLHENSLSPHETLFIDDSPQHIAGARTAGIDARLLEKDVELKSLLETILN